MSDEAPITDDREPALVMTAMIDHVLDLAATRTAWDGTPIHRDERIHTPHKAIRRVTDHLAGLEARLAGHEKVPDRRHASASTTFADLAPFTEQDLEEVASRLTRPARVWADRLSLLTRDQLDRSPGHGWTFRQLAFHLAESVYYADAVGDLSPTAPGHRQPASRPLPPGSPPALGPAPTAGSSPACEPAPTAGSPPACEPAPTRRGGRRRGRWPCRRRGARTWP